MIKIKATTLKVAVNSVESTAPKAPNKSAKIPPAPVTLICNPSTSTAASLMVSTMAGRAGSPLGSGVTILLLEISTLINSASPSSEGIGKALAPLTR